MAPKTRWYFATCPRGLETVLEHEIRHREPNEVNARVGGVAFRSDVATAYTVLLWSRVAGRVLEELERGKIDSAADVYKVTQRIDWQRLIEPGQTFAVTGLGRSHQIDNTHFAALKVKDALVDQIREATGARPDVDTEDPDLPLRAHLAGKVLTISRDLAGASLHKRGYRQGPVHKSPLNEALASGLLTLSGWDRRTAVCDPMCGSGTFLIEAAFLAGDRAPGLRRPMVMERWPDHDAKLWKRLLTEAENKWDAGRSKIPRLHANDRHFASIDMVRKSAREAEVDIQISEGSCEHLTTDARWIVTNPPYGERLEGPTESWEALGNFMWRHPGSTAWVLCGEPSLTRSLRLKTTRRIPISNGAIDCRWLRYDIRERNKPDEQPAVD